METNATRMWERLVGLGDVTAIGIDDDVGEPIRVHIETRGERPRCVVCQGQGEGPPPGRVGRSGVFRTAGAIGVAQDPLAVLRCGLWRGVLDRTGAMDLVRHG